jgi:hypothetical protein
VKAKPSGTRRKTGKRTELRRASQEAKRPLEIERSKDTV